MKKLSLSLLFTSFLYVTSPALAQDFDLEDYANRFIAAERQAWIEGDFTALESIEDSGVTYHGYGIENFAAHKQYISNFRETQKVGLMEMTYLTGDGSLFAADYHSITTTDGQQSETRALMLFRISPENGKITDVWLGANSTPVPE